MSRAHEHPPRAAPPEAPSGRPGALLRQARDAAGLGARDLADRLRLDAQMLAALEADDYAALPAPAFVKGYIRALAKELGVEPQPIVAAYERCTPQQPPALADFESRAPLQVTSGDRLVKGATFGVMGVIAALVALWWHGHEELAPPSAPASDASVESAEARELAAPPAAPLSYDFTVVEHPEVVAFPGPATDQAAMAGPAVPDTAAGHGPANPDTVVVAGPADAAPAGSIEIRATDESWIEVSDRSGKRLYYDVAKAGAQIDLAGEPPYSLVIGNARSVRLRYQGRAIDLRPFSREGVARLELRDQDD